MPIFPFFPAKAPFDRLRSPAFFVYLLCWPFFSEMCFFEKARGEIFLSPPPSSDVLFLRKSEDFYKKMLDKL